MSAAHENERETSRSLTALAFLAAVRHDRVTEALELLTADPLLATMSIRTACAAGDLASARAILDEDPTQATRTLAPDHTPPLVYALTSELKRARGVSEFEQAELVRLLLAHGGSANTTVTLPDAQGVIPVLYFPCIEGNVPVARVLLEHGAHPTDGESVHHAAQHDQRAILDLLLEFGADLSKGPPTFGNSPLYFLASHRVTNPIAPAVVRGMMWLLQHGADPRVPLTVITDGQCPSQAGETPLHRLVANGYGAEVLTAFVTHGADIEVERDDGTRPYALAVRSGNSEAATWLKSQGADQSYITATDRLLAACLAADTDEAQAILKQHPRLMSEFGDTEATALLHALQDERLDAVQLMLSLGWPLTAQSAWGGTALHWAAWNAQVLLVRELLTHQAPVNVRDTRYGSSPIAWAAHGSLYSGKGSDDEYVRIVEMLLDAGATRDESINRWQEPPESMAREAIVQVLRMRGFLPHAN